MESFNNNLQGGKKLVKSLEKQAVRRRAWSTTPPPRPPAPLRRSLSRASPRARSPSLFCKRPRRPLSSRPVPSRTRPP